MLDTNISSYWKNTKTINVLKILEKNLDTLYNFFFNEEFINMYSKTRGISSDSEEVGDVLNLFYTCNNGDEFVNRFKTVTGG